MNMNTRNKIRKYVKATKFDDWLVKVCGLNYTGYLLPRWKRIVVGLGLGKLITK